MNGLQTVKLHLEPGRIYRRSDISRWTNVDRHLNRLQQEKTLIKIRPGIYYCPKESVFCTTPPGAQSLRSTK